MQEGFDYDYMWMLDRVYSKVGYRAARAEPFEVPRADVVIIGSYTVLRNFKEIVDRLRREPRHLQRYLLRELAAAGSIDESGALIVHGRFSKRAIDALLEMYVKHYVKCPTCGSWDTVLERRGKIWFLRCEACGAETSVRSI